MATTRSTPARRRHNNVKENIYFEPGKQGRRTGLTLQDTGIRDEFGLEPVSGIFSSPEPTPKQQNGPLPDITDTLNLRKTPHLPPKTQTPRHTNIKGSPVRHSSVRPESRHASSTRPLSEQPSDRANRLLDFTKNKQQPVRTSVEGSPSPFKPRPPKSARLQKTRKSIFNFDESPVKRVVPARSDSVELERTVQLAQDAMDSIIDGAVDSVSDDQPSAPSIEDDPTDPTEHEAPTSHTQLDSHISQISEDADLTASPSISGTSSNQKRKREQLRVLENLAGSATKDQSEPQQKRRKSGADLTILTEEEEHTHAGQTFVEPTFAETSFTEQTMEDLTHAEPTLAEATVVDQTVVEPTYAETSFANETDLGARSEVAQPTPFASSGRKISPIHRDGDAAGDSEHVKERASSPEDFIPPPDSDHEQEQELETVQPKPKKRGRKPFSKQKARKASVPAEQGPSARARDNDSAETDGGSKKKGPKSIVQLRAGTPMEDDGATMTRSGRASIKPLKYWCNESFIWRHGEVDGVVRADELSDTKTTTKRGKTKKRAALNSIREDEDDEDEDLLPEAWEDELGVINGRVRNWEPELGFGNPEDEVHEDIAFSSTAIVTRDVQGSAFRYAKVTALPFFGCGMVEIPPEGCKRLKNSRKMQMVFFVHEGKVTVEVADIKFGMSKGGVWQVPRGNNYAIFNESKRHSAKIFFAQGCEQEANIDEAGPA